MKHIDAGDLTAGFPELWNSTMDQMEADGRYLRERLMEIEDARNESVQSLLLTMNRMSEVTRGVRNDLYLTQIAGIVLLLVVLLVGVGL